MTVIYEADEPPSITAFAALTTYLSYALLIVFGHFRDFLARATRASRFLELVTRKAGYSQLLQSWENFYTRRLYHRIQDVFNRPVSSSPGAWIDVVERSRGPSDLYFKPTGTTKRCLNLGSYNYLGFADDWEDTCGGMVLDKVSSWPAGVSASRMDTGTTSLHVELEERVAEFVGKEAAIVFNMGYGTNSTTVPALVSKGSLVFSDEFNHTSLVNGCRASGAHTRIFKHNDAVALAEGLRDAISMGMPRTRRPWKKILVMVEGVYSMEGEICNLKAIADVCKRHKAYLYLDEAHSIGALGKTGRGVCEQCGVDTKDVDVMMGTFTKSFGGMGGYIASSKEVIDHLRVRCSGMVLHNALSPIVCAQIIAAFKVIQGEDGTAIGSDKLTRLKSNANYFREEMVSMGLHVYGDNDSPVVPVLLYNPAKIAAFSRECYRRGLAVVTVGFPATSVVMSRARFCVSAGHTKADLRTAIDIIREVATLLKMRYAHSITG